MALRFASPELRAEAAMVWAAVNQAGAALQFASADLTESKPHVLAAVQQVKRALPSPTPG
jgi:hypothetical protein